MTDTELQQQLLSLETETVTPQQTEAYDGCYDLNVLAYTATQQYFDLAAGGGEEKGEEEVEVEENELDVWRRNANGPVTRRVQAVQGMFIASLFFCVFVFVCLVVLFPSYCFPYVISCCVMSCHVILYCVMLCYALAWGSSAGLYTYIYKYMYYCIFHSC